jgi:hypothetical protein
MEIYMKKNLLTLFFSLLVIPLASEAASSASIEHVNTSGSSFDGVITHDIGLENTTTGGHSSFAGDFNDTWDFKELPSAWTFNITNSGAALSSLNIEYCIFSDATSCNSSSDFKTYYSGDAVSGGSLTESIVDISAFRLRIWGEGNEGSSYVLAAAPVTPVPLPGAVWLLGSALMGLVGLTRRKAVKS